MKKVPCGFHSVARICLHFKCSIMTLNMEEAVRNLTLKMEAYHILQAVRNLTLRNGGILDCHCIAIPLKLHHLIVAGKC